MRSVPETRMLIPLYSDPPSSYWNQVIAANTYHNIDAIINPADGVGNSKQSSYVTGISQLRSAGVGIFGYIYTEYGSRDINAVKNQVDTYQLWYGVDGIFFDEADNTQAHLSYYVDIYNYVHSKGMSVVSINPGTSTIEGYMNASDNVCVYETSPYNTIPYPNWAKNYPASKFCALQYSSTREQMISFVADAKSKNIGYVYVNDDDLPNPWDTVPSYLAEEASLLAGSGTSSSATPTPTVNSTPSVTTTPVGVLVLPILVLAHLHLVRGKLLYIFWKIEPALK